MNRSGTTKMGAAVVGLVCLLFVETAFATVGGPRSVEVLGYDAGDAKLYWLVSEGGEGGELPRLYFLSGKTGKVTAVSSWYKGEDGGESTFYERLAALRKRLKPSQGDWTKLKWATSIVKRDDRDVEELPTATYDLQFSLSLADASASKKVRSYYDPAVRPVDLWVLPSGHAAVVIRYRGIWMEGGYDVDEVMVLPPGGSAK